MQERLETIIYDWVKKNFGESEAEEPSWNIKALAEEIYNHRWEVHRMVQEEYDTEDIKSVADGLDVELDDNELSLVLHRYGKIEDQNLEVLDFIIKDIKGVY